MENPSFGYLLLKTGGILIFLIVLMIGTSLLVKKYYGKIFASSFKGKQIKIIERCVISPKHSLFLVEVEFRRFLIGVSPQELNLLKELTDFSSYSETGGHDQGNSHET